MGSFAGACAPAVCKVRLLLLKPVAGASVSIRWLVGASWGRESGNKNEASKLDSANVSTGSLGRQCLEYLARKAANLASTSAAGSPSTLTRFILLASPATSVSLPTGAPRTSARKASSASFARPSRAERVP